MRSLIIVEIYVTGSKKKYSALQINCFYGELISPATINPT